eukprot:6121526-Amphidinium_carterae.1
MGLRRGRNTERPNPKECTIDLSTRSSKCLGPVGLNGTIDASNACGGRAPWTRSTLADQHNKSVSIPGFPSRAQSKARLRLWGFNSDKTFVW